MKNELRTTYVCIYICFCFVVLGIESGILHMLGKSLFLSHNLTPGFYRQKKKRTVQIQYPLFIDEANNFNITLEMNGMCTFSI
jgi:hypothetical protein